jgi:activator of HSP90 ATPase
MEKAVGSSGMPQRRHVIAGAAIALGAFAASAAGAATAQSARTSLHQDVEMPGTPERIFGILLDATQFAAFTGLKAQIDPAAGGAFAMFDGVIVGRNVEVVPGTRIVQAWRPIYWTPGVYSLVRFELKSQGAGTLIALDHTGFPEGDYDSLDSGWPPRYWDPLKKYLALHPS